MTTSNIISEEMWNLYIALAASSNVPEEFMNINPTKRRSFVNTAEVVFKRTFPNRLEANYAMGYAYAISLIKTWLNAFEAGLNLQERILNIRQDDVVKYYYSCANTLGCKPSEVPDTLVSQGHFQEDEIAALRNYVPTMKQIEGLEADLANHFAYVEKLKKSAMRTCASLAELEKLGIPPKIKFFKTWLQWHIRKGMKTNSNQQELLSLRFWVEEFFSDRQNQANVVLLAVRK